MRNAITSLFSACLLPLMIGFSLPAAAQSNPPIFSSSTVSDFLTACRTDQDACMAEIGSALMNKMDFSGKSNICISSMDYGTAVPKWLIAHPETSRMAVEDGIYTAIKALYPCA